VTLDGEGDAYVADFSNGRIRRIDSSTAAMTTAAGGARLNEEIDARNAELGFSPPFQNGLAINSSGNLVIADFDGNRVWQVDGRTAVISLVAGRPDGAFGFGADGEEATEAALAFPSDVAIDGSGNILIDDFANVRIRRVDATKRTITTVAGNGNTGYSGDGGPATSAQLNSPEGTSVDPWGNIFIADTANERVRRVDAVTGVITTVAGDGQAGFGGDGGPAVRAQLNFPIGAVADTKGNLFIADSGNNRIREVSTTGEIRTVAGSGAPTTCSFGGDGGPATSALLCFPVRVVVDGWGNLFIADQGNNRVRRVDRSTGRITTVAGNGAQGFSGDGGSALAAALDAPFALTLDACGDLFIADAGCGRVREVVFSPAPLTTMTDSCFGGRP
jgi:sugar lactone lactonase YvrE